MVYTVEIPYMQVCPLSSMHAVKCEQIDQLRFSGHTHFDFMQVFLLS